MLSQLSVKNLAVVEQLELSFSKGMSVVTGETGAGKSILLQALNLALGSPSDFALIRQDTNQTQVSASFEIADCQRVKDYLLKQSLTDHKECILRRILERDGRSKSFVNGVKVPLSVMRKVGELLVDSHGQNQHQLLLRTDQQQQLLDAYGNTTKLCMKLNEIATKHSKISTELDKLTANQTLQQQQQTLLKYQLNELQEAQLTQPELDSIAADFKTSANATTLMNDAKTVLEQLESENGVNAQLSSLNKNLSSALEMDKKLSAGNDLLGAAQLQVQEAIYELNHYLNNLNIDSEATADLELRLDKLHNLSRKHNTTIPQLLSIQTAIEQQLKDISTGGERLDEKRQQISELQANYQQTNAKLSTIRTQKAQQLSALVSQTIQQLGMPGGELMIDLSIKKSALATNGTQAVEFLVKTNKGQDFKPLKKIASGGELSRISLAISLACFDTDYTPTVIFDEVDIGISGAVAQAVGQKLKQLSSHYQVLCITHLSQVAALSDQHLKVNKIQQHNRVQTTVIQLSNTERITELARIVSGIQITDKTLTAAAEMLKN